MGGGSLRKINLYSNKIKTTKPTEPTGSGVWENTSHHEGNPKCWRLESDMLLWGSVLDVQGALRYESELKGNRRLGPF